MQGQLTNTDKSLTLIANQMKKVTSNPQLTHNCDISVNKSSKQVNSTIKQLNLSIFQGALKNKQQLQTDQPMQNPNKQLNATQTNTQHTNVNTSIVLSSSVVLNSNAQSATTNSQDIHIDANQSKQSSKNQLINTPLDKKIETINAVHTPMTLSQKLLLMSKRVGQLHYEQNLFKYKKFYNKDQNNFVKNEQTVDKNGQQQQKRTQNSKNQYNNNNQYNNTKRNNKINQVQDSHLHQKVKHYEHIDIYQPQVIFNKNNQMLSNGAIQQANNRTSNSSQLKMDAEFKHLWRILVEK